MASLDRDGYVRVRGKRLYYRRCGTGDRGTVLTLHGGPGLTHEYLTPLADLAGAGYEVVFYDQLGCGDSERPASYRDYTIRSGAEDVEELRRRLKLGRVHLFGHSYGGALALETALRHPRGLRSLTVAGGFASMRTLWKGYRQRLLELSTPNRRAILRAERTGVTTPGALRGYEEFRRRFTEHVENRPYEVWRTLTRGNARILRTMGFAQPQLFEHGYRTGTMAGWDVAKELGRIRTPTLVTVGEYDHVVPACSREIHRGIRRARLVVQRGQGHMPFFEDRDAYVSLLAGFLNGVR
jgi:proline-specific peptidase